MFKGTHQRPQISRALIPLIIFLFLIPLFSQLSQSALVQAEQSQIQHEAVSALPLSVTKQDSLLVDKLGNGQANPGDTIQYSVVISNGTASDASNVLLTDTLDSNVTFVPGSLKTTPLAFDGAETTDEDVAVVLTLTGSDPDGDTLAFSIVSGPTDGSLGSISSLTATSATVTYTPDTGFSGTDSFIFRVTDNDAGTDTAVFTLTIDPAVDNPPTLDLDANNSSGAGGNNYNTSFVEDGGAVPVADADVTITDDGANMETAVFTLTNHPDGSDESLSVNGALPGGLSTTIDPTGFVITITGSTTLANYETAIRQVEYNNISNTPTESNRTVTVVVNDGTNDSNTATATISVTAANDAPVLDLDADDSTGATGGNVNVDFTEDAGAVTLSDGISINDVDDADLETAVITLTNVQDGTAESLSVNSGLATGFGIGVIFGSNNQSITLTGTATRDEYRQVLETVMYDNSDDDPNSATRNVTFVVNDGDINSNTTTAYITITPVNDPPGATDDTYNNVVGNTLYAVGIVMPPSPVVTATGTVLANDTDPEMGTLSISTFDNPSVQGGTVAMQNDGTFTYLPPLGFEGADSFTYTVTDGSQTQTATVNLTVTDVVWYIDNTAAGGGDGRSQTPFNSLTAFNTAQGNAGAADPETGDYIFVYEGTGDSTNLNVGITLLDDQQLIGQGVDLIVGANTLVSATTNPTLTNGAGNGVTLASGNTIRGMTINSTSLTGITGNNVGNLTVSDTAVTNAGRLAVALANGTLNAAFTTLSSSSSSSRGINLDNVSGSFTVSGNTSIADSGTEAIRVVNSDGLTADFGSTTITNAGTDGVTLTGNAGSSFTFDTLSITTTGGRGLVADNSGTVNINDTGTAITAVAGAAVDIVNTAGQTNGSSGWTFDSLTSTNSSGDGVNLDTLSDNFTTSSTTTISGPTGSGIDIQNSSTTISFAGVNINSPVGAAVTVNGGAPTAIFTLVNSITAISNNTNRAVVVQNTTGGSVTFNGNGRVRDNGGTGILISSAAGAVTVADFFSGASVNGIDIQGGSGTVLISDGTINNATGTAFNVNGGSGTIIYTGGIGNTAERAVLIENRTGGSVTFNGGTISDTAPGLGILLQNNSGGTTNFAGTLTLNTGANAAFTATSGGTLHVTGSSNTINTTTGTALNVTNTTIGASGIAFQSISANGAAKGIVLNNTGSSGGFTLTGTGTTDGSGGTLQNITDRGIELIDTQNVSISNMDLTDAATTQDVATGSATCDEEPTGTNTGCNAPIHMVNATTVSLTNLTINGSVQHGINGNNVNGLTISNTDISNIGDANKENGMHFINLLGTVTFNNVSVIGSYTRNVLIENNTGTAVINLTNSTINTAQNEDGFFVIGGSNGGNDADITLNVTDSSFTHNGAGQLKAHAEDNSTVDVTITGNDFDGQPTVVGGFGIDLAVRDNANLTFDVIGTVGNPQTFQPLRSHAVNVFASGGGTASGTIDGNVIQESRVGAGVRVVAQVTDVVGFNPAITVAVQNNTISNIQGAGLGGIHIESRDGSGGLSGTANVQATLNNNSVTINGADSVIQALINGGNTMCLDVTNNSAAGAATSPYAGAGSTHYIGNPIPGNPLGDGTVTYDGYINNDLGGTWNANGNTPTLAAGISGEAYVDGTQPTNGTCSTVTLLSSASTVSPTLTASDVNMDIGTLPTGKAMTVSFDVIINNPFPDGVTQISNQASVSATGGGVMVSDDPDTVAADDATVTPVAPIMTTYLPFVANNYAVLPDLVVSSLTLSGGTVSVVVENIGDTAVVDDFWVDVYIDPNPVPTAVNQIWPLLAKKGLVWGVTGAALPLDPGERLTLTVGDTYYVSSLSNFSGIVPAGTPVYAQVDSANTLTTYGAVMETHEANGAPYNNITGITATSFVHLFANIGVDSETAVPITFLPDR